MNPDVHPAKGDEVPEIVPIVLQQAFKFHALGRIDRRTFEEQLERLQREELHPKGLSLAVQSLHDGGANFVIQESKTGSVCAQYKCPAPLREGDSTLNGRSLPPPPGLFPGASSSLGIQPSG